MKVLIVDDEAPARSRLRQLLAEMADVEIVGEAANGREALSLCYEQQPDALLLDIRMPDMDGIETARHLRELDDAPAVIFTTAFDSYAIDAFDAHAVGYLLKPVRRELLARALKQASRLTSTQISALNDSGAASRERTNICVRKPAGLKLIPIEDIIFFRAEQKYVSLFTRDGEELLDEPLKDLAAEFADRFIRIHRSVLIALSFLEGMERDADGHYEVRLRHCDQPLPVSRRHVTAVKACLKRIA